MLCYAHFKEGQAGLVTNYHTDSHHTLNMLIDFSSIALVLERNMALGLNRIYIINPLEFFHSIWICFQSYKAILQEKSVTIVPGNTVCFVSDKIYLI